MLKLLVLLFTLFICFNIFSRTGIKRLGWFFMGIIFVPHYVFVIYYPVPISFHQIIIYTLLISLLYRYKSFSKEISYFPFKYIFLFLFISHLCVGIFDARLAFIPKLYRPITHFTLTFLPFILAYCSVKKSNDWNYLLKLFIKFSIILTVYGIFNFVTKSNPIDSILTKEFNAVSIFSSYIEKSDGRFRINSFIAHPIAYGYVVGILLLVFFSTRYSQYKNKIFSYSGFIIIQFLLFINLLLSNSRSPILAIMLGLIVFILQTLKVKAKFKILFLAFALITVSYSAVPAIQEKADNIVDIFTSGGNQVQGSSVKMRIEQLAASVVIFSQNPVFGNGYNYIREGLGFSVNKDDIRSSREFRGFESYAYVLLIEQGLVQIISISLFFISLFLFYFKRAKTIVPYAGLGSGILMAFYLFIMATGTLGTFLITMSILGALTKIIVLKDSSSNLIVQKQYNTTAS